MEKKNIYIYIKHALSCLKFNLITENKGDKVEILNLHSMYNTKVKAKRLYTIHKKLKCKELNSVKKRKDKKVQQHKREDPNVIKD